MLGRPWGSYSYKFMSIQSILRSATKYVLLLVAITPIVVFRYQVLYPYLFSKALFFRVVVEVAAMLALLYALGRSSARAGSDTPRGAPIFNFNWRKLARTPFVIFLTIFFISATLSTLTAVDNFHAFWGDIERGDGLFNLLHLFTFLALTLVIFDKRDWTWFFRISLGVGAIMMFYGWLQYLGVKSFPFALNVSGRPGSFFDNPLFLGAYLILLAIVASIIYHVSSKASFWRYFAALVGIGSLLTIFITDSRGTLLGLFGGLVFLLLFLAFRPKKDREVSNGGLDRRKLSRILIGVMALLFVLFWFTRGTGLWQSIPGVRRLTNFTLADSSLKTRLISLESSSRAFLEKPIFGWGLENFMVAYNKHYNPDYALYEEAWFDRAHNKVVEVGVTQGTFGLLAYLGIFASFLHLLFRKDGPEGNVMEEARPFIAAGVIAYFIQNLFLFDIPEIYVMLFSIFGFWLWARHHSEPDQSGAQVPRKFSKTLFTIPVFVMVPVAAYVLYAYNILPFYQVALYRQTTAEKIGEKILTASPRFLTPYNFLQPKLRFYFAEAVSDPIVLRNPKFNPLVEKAIGAVGEVVEREPKYDPRNYIILAEIYNERAKDNPELFKRSEAYLRRALELSPKRQDIYYHLAFALAGQGRYPEAIEVAREAVALSPRVAKAHYNLGIELALAGKEYWDEARQEFARAQDIGFVKFLPNDLKNILVVYKEMLYAYIVAKDKGRIVEVAERFKKIKPEFTIEMETVIDLAGRGDWETLVKALGIENPLK